MAVKRNGLGKGLDSLIPNKTVKTTEKQANKTQKEKVKVEKSGESGKACRIKRSTGTGS